MARFLVQVRQHGEPWLTAWEYSEPAGAERCAALLANQTRSLFNLKEKALPLHAHVRVIHRGRLVFDPRAVVDHVNKVGPSTGTDKGETVAPR